jgi:HPt (histidine-containing phosphotransfer) domain-containing protein
MAYQNTHLEAMIAAAIGDDPALLNDLRTAFLSSAEDHLRTLEGATAFHDWTMAAWKFKGLCATFGARELVDLAGRACEAPTGDADILRELRQALTACSQDD